MHRAVQIAQDWFAHRAKRMVLALDDHRLARLGEDQVHTVVALEWSQLDVVAESSQERPRRPLEIRADRTGAARRQKTSLHARWHEPHAARRGSSPDLAYIPLHRGEHDLGHYLRRKQR